ncbi:subtilisin-like protein [Trametopsis cervina]|nr:subtilisin-like protein [Trametopsis cervina]
MMLLTAALILLTATAPCLGSPPLVRHESRRALPPNWERSHRAPADTILPLRIGLAQNNIDRIEELLMDVSHPDSPNYGNHWSASEVASMFRPSSETVDTVRDWLHTGGIEPSRVRLSNSGGWLEANVSVAEAERLLKTEYHVYNHALTDIKHFGCASGYHVPEHVSKHVELITPTIHFDAILNKRRPEMQKRKGPSVHPGQPGFGPVSPKSVGAIKNIIDELENCDTHITPLCLRALYEFVYVPVAPKKNSIGIVEYTPQAYVPSDLDLFFTNFSKSQVGERPVLVSIDGGVVQTTETGFNVNGESNLDLQFSMALVGKSQPVTLYQVGDIPQGASFNNLLDALDGSFCTFEGGDDPTQDGIYPDPLPGGYKGAADCGAVKPASVISTSYSYNEADLTPFYTARQCAEYAKLGLMGVTILYSSGDEGVGGGGDVCLFPNGTQSSAAKGFNPTFPSTCPFITSVGATQVVAGHKVTDPESATYEVIFSGGGFSNYFPIPDYQKPAVQSFLKNHPPPYPPSIWNSTGQSRAFPDISANGANYAVAVDGQFERVFGTSCSSPVLASILSAINDARLAIGKKPIGFINPTVYSDNFRSAFNDIKNGTNPGCGTVGFSAVEGWDPVTGLGTPNFPKLLTKWLLLP